MRFLTALLTFYFISASGFADSGKPGSVFSRTFLGVGKAAKSEAVNSVPGLAALESLLASAIGGDEKPNHCAEVTRHAIDLARAYETLEAENAQLRSELAVGSLGAAGGATVTGGVMAVLAIVFGLAAKFLSCKKTAAALKDAYDAFQNRMEEQVTVALKESKNPEELNVVRAIGVEVAIAKRTRI